ncbi:hypothetical protein BLS_002611 [Venturia inaequalis]|uniref:BZIP domain-containing protein n=1 Tax=Venturia inaequalis TaxID=5025 RepID=A0A8H3V7E2_VENIN|nr:hypothetical protein BLS_002611 [Venturia inaequalis]KAE9983420.1 hypothetical protein EG327_005463 [Venturia inaequalis]KAE9989094.1 hypothetical protein EG328_000025 [Venturia inaequalis]
MAFPDFHCPSSQLDIDRKPSTFSHFDDQDISDDLLLESDMISPTSTDDRRHSFGNNTAAVFSPQSNVWEDHYTTATMTERPQSHFQSANPFHNNNPFLQQEPSAFGNHNPQWPGMFDQSSDSRTPVGPAVYEPFTGDFDASHSSAFPHAAPTVAAFGGVRPQSVFPPVATPVSMPASPHTRKDWMAIAEQADSRPYPKRMRQNSPPRPYSPFPRRDGGIRKKNAKFNIPPERTLETVDQLIASATTDDEIKELKQQKRLLRNRQAAYDSTLPDDIGLLLFHWPTSLDSRQRKKQRAEELEEENKKWTNQISLLEDEIQKLHVQNDHHLHEKDQLMLERAQLQEQIHDLTEEKVMMLERHTNETGDLRAKIAVLTEQLEIAASAMPERSSSGEYSDFTSEMNGLNMHHPHDWDFLVSDFVMESEPADQKPQETALTLAPKKKDALLDEEQPAASGLLMLLLLCGAWVASKTSGSSMPTMPTMSDDVRAASAVVLESVMKDAGVSDPSQAFSGLSNPSPSGAARQLPFHMADTTSRNHRLDAVHSKLITPSKAQEADAAFSMSVSQYDNLTQDFKRPSYSSSSDDEAITPSTSTSSHRRNLADTLKAMRDDAKGESTSNVYTRSLLWDRIPTDIVQQFKQIVDASVSSGEGGGGGDD